VTLSRRVARFNRRVTNRVTRPFVPYLPGFGLLVHTGRRSGHTYRTPVNVFARDNRFVIALTYGPEAQWVKNVVAAGGCDLETRGRRHRLVDPEIVHDGDLTLVPPVVRPMLRLIGVADFLLLRES
jgi:deazaflavin-dependent oxidoreductase (nitroreductase family)